MTYLQFPKKLLQISYISANAKILYCVLYDMKRAQKAKSKKNYAEVKQKTLALKMNLSERQIINLLNELEKNKFITRERYSNMTTFYFIAEPDALLTDIDMHIKEKMNK